MRWFESFTNRLITNRRFHSLVIGALLSGFLGTMLTACDNGDDPSAATQADSTSEAEQAAYVRAAAVTQAPASEFYRFSSVLRAADQAKLAFLVSGELTDLPVKIGDQVVADQKLAAVRNPQLGPAASAANARVAELQTRLSQARRDRNRVAQLRESGAATREEYEQVDAQYRALVSSLNTAQAGANQAGDLAAETRLKAPFSGTISALTADIGDFVAAGQPVISLTGATQLEIELGVPETLLNQLRVGQNVQIELPLQQNKTVSGTISEIATAAPAAGRLFPVVVTIASDMASTASTQLRPGLAVEVIFTGGKQRSRMVPLASVVSPGTGSAYVFRVNADNRVEKVSIQVGNIQGEYITVTDGQLRQGDLVVYAGLSGLLAGETVQVLPTSK